MGGGQSVAAKGPLEPCIYMSTVIASEFLFDSMLYSAGVLLQTIPILVSSRLHFQVTHHTCTPLLSLACSNITSQRPSVVTIIARTAWCVLVDSIFL
jgi:hypothetical protein